MLDVLAVADAHRAVAAVVLYVIGAAHGAQVARTASRRPSPTTVELEDVDYRYRCIVCGAEAVLYAAPEGEDPDAAPPLPGGHAADHAGRLAGRSPQTCGQVCGELHVCDSATSGQRQFTGVQLGDTSELDQPQR